MKKKDEKDTEILRQLKGKATVLLDSPRESEAMAAQIDANALPAIKEVLAIIWRLSNAKMRFELNGWNCQFLLVTIHMGGLIE
ncbi:hypothetical protein V6N11_036747 [Hibiscus sabdariffa]|uniref:Uncharacterized protein n=1 Tax=Hibiscus sabdariffa TaxID=183260 RepID=A0ABR2RBL0_9ROSI